MAKTARRTSARRPQKAKRGTLKTFIAGRMDFSLPVGTQIDDVFASARDHGISTTRASVAQAMYSLSRNRPEPKINGHDDHKAAEIELNSKDQGLPEVFQELVEASREASEAFRKLEMVIAKAVAHQKANGDMNQKVHQAIRLLEIARDGAEARH